MNEAERRRIFGPLRPMNARSAAERARTKARVRLAVAVVAALIAALLTSTGRWIGI